jgi:serine phosphatase RsbU (regulator of sigma subunit)
VSGLQLSPGSPEPDPSAVRRGVSARLTTWLRTLLRPGVAMGGRLPVRRRLALLALLGLTLTLSVAGAALLCLGQLNQINQQLAEVNTAQRFHQDADMMHDALRADVVRAQQASAGVIGVDPAVVSAEASQHAARFRKDIGTLSSLQLPENLRQAVTDLRPTQRAYVVASERLVHAALDGPAGQPTARDVRTSYDRSFHALVSAQGRVTEQLATASARTAQAAADEKAEAVRMIAVASLAAMAGWMALVVWHHRSIGNLNGALVREAAHRSAADLLQRSLQPARLPVVAGVELAGRSLPGELGRRVGGDWYDVIPLPTGELGLVVGDVVGHDLAAASAMGQLRNALRAYALDDPSPAGVLARVNRAADLLDVVELATCLYAIVDPTTLTVRWASAGHLAPLVSGACGTARLLCTDPGPPLGAIPAPEYADSVLQLLPGEALALYTDGLVERRGESIEAGLADLTAIRGPHPSADAMCDRLLSCLPGDSPQSDDVTLLVLQTQSPDEDSNRVA